MRALVVAGSLCTVCAAAASAEPYIPEKPKEMEDVVRVGTDVGHYLDSLPPGQYPGENPDPIESEPEQSHHTTVGYTLVGIAAVLGLAYFVYGRNKSSAIFMAASAILILVPYTITDTMSIALLTVAAAAIPPVWKHYS